MLSTHLPFTSSSAAAAAAANYFRLSPTITNAAHTDCSRVMKLHKVGAAYFVLLFATVLLPLPTRSAEVTKESEEFEKELCKEKEAGEWFRLVVGEGDSCRDVIQCTSSGLQAIRCPAGLAFDIEKQTCDWKDRVKSCSKKSKEKKGNHETPLLYTDEPLCAEKQLACGDGDCIEHALFCNGEKDCNDGSDETYCDINHDRNRAPPCDKSVCVLPDCFCSEDGTAIPGDLPSASVPQMITITFDDAINNNNIDLYKEIFNGKQKNPNGCQIRATFFLSHKYTNYSAVQEMHRRGHEIASHSITHNGDENFWSNAIVDGWAKEMAGIRSVSAASPNRRLRKLMEEQAFLYDSTVTASLMNPPLWPYTMYFRMPHKCHGNVQNCPTRSHAVWEMVMNELDRREDPTIDEDLPGCAMVDSCNNILTGDQFYNFLNYNFDRHYQQNRAPMGLYFHAAWLKNNPEFLGAFTYWIDEVLEKHDDVYFVSNTQVIQWMQNPRTKAEVKSFDPWKEKCDNPEGRSCSTPNGCSQPQTAKKFVPCANRDCASCLKDKCVFVVWMDGGYGCYASKPVSATRPILKAITTGHVTWCPPSMMTTPTADARTGDEGGSVVVGILIGVGAVLFLVFGAIWGIAKFYAWQPRPQDSPRPAPRSCTLPIPASSRVTGFANPNYGRMESPPPPPPPPPAAPVIIMEDDADGEEEVEDRYSLCPLSPEVMGQEGRGALTPERVSLEDETPRLPRRSQRVKHRPRECCQ